MGNFGLRGQIDRFLWVNECESLVIEIFPEEVEEGFQEVVCGFGADIVKSEVFLPVKSNHSLLDFNVFLIVKLCRYQNASAILVRHHPCTIVIRNVFICLSTQQGKHE